LVWLGLAFALTVGGVVGYRATRTTPDSASPPISTRELGGAPEAPIREVSVIVYTTSWCPVCKRAKTWLRTNGIAFEERDIEASSENARKIRILNPRASIPTIDVDGEVMIGFSESEMISMLEHAAHRRSAGRM
jgi:glutaredoxin 3